MSEASYLFRKHGEGDCLPPAHEPRRPRHFHVARIYLAKGSLSTAERRAFVEQVCAVYSNTEIIRCPDVPHNRIKLESADPLELHRQGKNVLVLGEHASAVRFSEEEGNTCPNYWHFSPYGYCPYGCKYCYLAGTPGVWYSPTVKIYVNLGQIISSIDHTASRLARPVAFYIGKLQDGLALDPLTAYSTVLVPFFARHPYARQIILTKSAHVERLLGLDHSGHTILSWSLNPPEIAREFEENAPSVEDRLRAMRRCNERGYPLRAVIMPIIPVPGWPEIYARFVTDLLEQVPLQRLTLGGICSYKNALSLMERKLGKANIISRNMGRAKSADGRIRYSSRLRVAMYQVLIRAARRVNPRIELALCLEELAAWKALGLEHRRGRCNCVL